MADRAYVAIVGQPYTIGVAVRNEAGYNPLVEPPAFETYEEAKAEADARNEVMGVSRADAIQIIGSSMAAQRRSGR